MSGEPFQWSRTQVSATAQRQVPAAKPTNVPAGARAASPVFAGPRPAKPELTAIRRGGRRKIAHNARVKVIGEAVFSA